jgi:hypothetical protein
MKRRGFAAGLVVLIIAIILVAGAGVWYYKMHSNAIPHIDSLSPSSTITVSSGITVSIPATTTDLSPLGTNKDPYGLFNITSDFTNYMSDYANLSYLKDGRVESGPYAGYDRIISIWGICDGEDGCPPFALLLATKDYKSFILDNSSTSKNILETLADNGIYLNTEVISGQASIPFSFPKTIGAGTVTFENQNSYSTSTEYSPLGDTIESPVGGLSMFSSANLPEATSSFNSLEQNTYIETVNEYTGGSTDVLAEDAAGVFGDYIIYYNNNFLNGIASNTDLFTGYGSEDCYGGNNWYPLKNIFLSDLIALGTNASGTVVYGLRDPNHPLNQAAYYSEVSSVADFSALNDGVAVPTFEEFVAKHPVLIVQDPFGRFLGIDEDQYSYVDMGNCGGKKPVIYLYPQKTEDVTVQFASPINLSLSIPTYTGKWDVLANPDGELQDLQPELTDCNQINSTMLGSEYAKSACDKNDYPYLYWAGYMNKPFPNINEGWVVSKNDVGIILDKELTAAGLDQKEKDDMMDYWVPELSASGAPYYRISFLQTAQMNELVPLNISPEPDTEFRIFLLWTPLTAVPAILPQPQTLQPLVRNGFTVVEWGGGKE